MPFFVYLLTTSNQKYTYIGATIDLQHRLRQHNKEIQGGAKYTTTKVQKGYLWRRIVYVSGFPDWKTALQFEWAWKFYSRKINSKSPIERRLKGLLQLLSLEKCTSNAIPYSLWETQPEPHFETPEIQELYSIYNGVKEQKLNHNEL